MTTNESLPENRLLHPMNLPTHAGSGNEDKSPPLSILVRRADGARPQEH